MSKSHDVLFPVLISCVQSAEKFYNISSVPENDDEEEDIEASIQRELNGMTAKKDVPKLFQPVFLDVQCVLFFKTQPPIDPVDFVHRICEEAVQNPKGRKHRFLNRLTPMTRMGRATEKDMEDLAKEVLAKEFRLVDSEDEDEGEEALTTACSVSYAFCVISFTFDSSSHYKLTALFLPLMNKDGGHR
jgi:tRNA acetyltransferase TAN1